VCRDRSLAGQTVLIRAVEFRLLGAIEAVRGGRVLPLGGKQARALLAILLLHARQARSVDQLIEDLWADRAPATARSAFHNLTSGLRRTLGPGLLESAHGMYVLRVDGDRIDACRFEQLVEQAAAEHGEEKRRTLETALALWRGSALADVRYDEFAQPAIQRFEELRVTAQEDLVAVKLDLGDAHAVVAELQLLVATHPFRERLRMQLMLALHRSGRTVEAVTAFVEWRRLLIESWGLEPGAAIRELCDEIRGRAPMLDLEGVA
jgi:DNA-binding SARP family transcriptional activator